MMGYYRMVMEQYRLKCFCSYSYVINIICLVIMLSPEKLDSDLLFSFTVCGYPSISFFNVGPSYIRIIVFLYSIFFIPLDISLFLEKVNIIVYKI